MSAKIVALHEPPQTSAIDFCQRALKESKGEDYSAFVGVLFLKDRYRIFSTREVTHHELIGILTEAAFDAMEDCT